MKIKKRSSYIFAMEILAVFLVLIIVIACAGTDTVKKGFSKVGYPKEELDFIGIVKSASSEFGIDENFILAMIKAESNFKVDAESIAGAIGLMQIMPNTYEKELKDELGIQISAQNALTLPSVNIRCGTYYFAKLINHYGDVTAALAAYNAGQGRVDKWLKDSEYSKDGKALIPENIPYDETRQYVVRVMYYYEQYEGIYGPGDGSYEGRYKDNPIEWVTKPGKKAGQVIVNDLACYNWALKYNKQFRDVDPILIMAIIKTESDFVVNAVSKSGAYGLMQIMPPTYNVDIKASLGLEEDFEYLIEDPEFAIKCGSYYLHWLYAPNRGMNDSIVNIVAAYNGGCNAVKEWLRTDGLAKNGELIIEKIPKEETRRYVEKVLANYEYFAELYS
ncbi:MAG: lytic transglycosylase domain-containing protein [Clostridia bacterium]|nr:lytic transglycosylase domain-containing protein [Clostridia bacterium]